MRRGCLLALACFLLLPLAGRAQFESFGDIPVEITSDGETRFEEGVAVAEDNVQIHYRDISIYCDYAEYNPETRDILLVGNIRLYTGKELLTGQRAVYNLETKQMRAIEFQGAHYPLFFRALSLRAPSSRQFNVRNAMIAVHDSSKPDFHVKAKTVRIYLDDRVVFVNSTLYLGQTPIFWFPYLFGWTTNTGFDFRPGFDSDWGPYLLTSYSFPIGRGGNFIGTVRADWREKLGFAVGFDTKFQFGKDDRSFGLFRAYYAYDRDPDYLVNPGEPAESDDYDRYRVSFQHRLFLTDDIYGTFDINKLSDLDFLEDYFPNEFRTDPQPDNIVALTKWSEFYTLTLWTRWQMNQFFETTERLPELALDIKQHQMFGLPVNYDGESSVGQYRRAFAENSINPNYEAARFDTFHQLSYPKTYFGWLSLTPRVGFRGTAYSQSGRIQPALSEAQEIQIATLLDRAQQNRLNASRNTQLINSLQSQLNAPNLTPSERLELQSRIETLQASQEALLGSADAAEAAAQGIENGTLAGRELVENGAIFRPIFNAGIEGSFKLSRKYEWLQSRALGIDGVLHVTQPYANFSYVYNAGKAPSDVFQFDRLVPATQPLPIDFPQFVALDSIDTWNILRLGVRNRLITRRGDENYFDWFALDSFFDLNFDNPYNDSDVSNFINRLTFQPLPWAGLNVDAQSPINEDGFYDVNSSIFFMPYRDLFVQLTHRYLQDNPFFADSNQVSAYAYWRLNSNWAVSVQETYEAEEQLLLLQRYMIHRDLTSWTVSVGAEIRDNSADEREYSLLFTMTLKEAPQVTLPLAFDQGQGPLGSGN